MTEHDAFRFWGKARGGVHPALCHMVDAGMVAHTMLQRDQRVATRGVLHANAGLMAWWVALHDLGKISPGFQWKKEALAALLDDTLDRPAQPLTDHARVTYLALRQDGRVPPLDPRNLLARAVAAHHGAFGPPTRDGESRCGGVGWVAARQAAVAALAAVFGCPVEKGLEPLDFGPAQAMVLAGLTAVCDWIASDSGFFPPAGDSVGSLAEYAARSRGQAGKALDALGWDTWRPDEPALGFQALFGWLPNALQDQAVALADSLRGPTCVTIEAPMGQGKTEAALYLADRLLATNGHTGIYYALPTQATSGAMFRRFRDYVERRYPKQRLNLHLLHGMAAFDEAYEALCQRAAAPPDPADIHDEHGDGGVVAASWFRGAKLGLLSPMAVGTIDQALLGALQTRHQFVRLYGLAGKVVVLDEVHAYDAYTTGLMERLLSWLKVLGCSVILLSATLPRAKREALLKAWGGAKVAQWGDYPRLTVVGEQRAEAIAVPAEPKPLTLRPLPADAVWHQVVRDHLADQLRDGGCGAWLCNTVARAQEAILRLRHDPRFDGWDIDLFHARFPIGQRAEIEKRVLAKFGKGDRDPAKRAILVATQVIEQSLDLDFDVMVSDPAPMDLLLQRAGRVHRHERPRPTRLLSPDLWYLEPPRLEQAFEHFDASAGVYDDWLLLRTLVVLGRGATVTSPVDIEALVERVYGGDELDVPEGLAAAERAAVRWAAACDEQERLVAANGLCSPGSQDDPLDMTHMLPGDEFSDPALARQVRRAVTRLGEPSVMLVCVAGEHAGLSERELVARAVRVQHGGWVAHFANREVAEWRGSPVLRHWRLARFEGGWLVAEPGEMRLSDDLGLVLSHEVMDLMD